MTRFAFDGEEFDFEDLGAGVYAVPLDVIYRDSLQPRTEFDPEGELMLVASIRKHGVLQPITLAASGQGAFKIVAGERRFRAARACGLATIPARIMTERADSDEAALSVRRRALLENLQRRSLNSYVLTVDVMEHLVRVSGAASVDEVVRMLGRASRGKTLAAEAAATEAMQAELFHLGVNWLSFLKNNVRLLRLPRDLVKHLEAGRITSAVALELSLETDSRRRERLLSKALEEGLSSKQIRAIIRARTLPQPDGATEAEAPKPREAARPDAFERTLKALRRRVIASGAAGTEADEARAREFLARVEVLLGVGGQESVGDAAA